MVTISNSTISGNSGSQFGGGIYNNGTVSIKNSIVANSAAGRNCPGTMTSHGYNLSSEGSCNFNATGGLTETLALLSLAEVIDAGNANGCTDNRGRLLNTDQRGQPRPTARIRAGGKGAFESQP